MVIAAIVDAYARIADDRFVVLQRAAAYAPTALDQLKKQESEYRHSEKDLNEWAYALMRKGRKDQALTVFKLNAELYPQSSNVHDSLAECYEAMGDGDRAIASYKRSLELDPKNRHAEERLKTLG